MMGVQVNLSDQEQYFEVGAVIFIDADGNIDITSGTARSFRRASY